MITHTIGQSYKSGAGSTSSISKTYSSNTEVNIEDSITALATNFIITVGIDVSQIQSMMIYSDQPVTVKTNSNSSPVDTITLGASLTKMILWTTNNIEACPLTADVTSLHIACPGATAASFKLSVLLDLD
jgi:hypothetical protein